MGKKKKRSGGGGGGGCGSGGGGGGQQQEHAAEERDEKACADAEKGGDAAASGCDGNDKDKDTQKAGDDKDKDKDKGVAAGGCKDDKGKDKKPPPPLPVVTAVLKVDMHCHGCARRIRASVRRYAGVEGVAMEVDKGSMTVVGRFDAKKLRDRVARKTRKKVDLVGNNNSNNNKGGGEKKDGGCDKKGNDGDAKPEKKDDEGKELDKEGKDQDDKCGNAGKGKGGGKDNKKPAVPVIVTVVLKIGSVGLHCDGCMHKIRSKLFKIKGVEQVRMDFPKNQVTVIGTMDAKCLPEKLRGKLKRPVDVVAPGKDKDKDKDGKQQQQGEGGNKDGGKPQGDCKDGKQSKEAAEKAMAAELALWKTAYYDSQALQATQFLLSDENPNACAVM